jgi:hypothetical protein
MKSQHLFPRLEEYKKKFKITPFTIFAYDKEIYSNNELPEHLLIHELKHIERQNKIGTDRWVDLYLHDENFRLEEEIIAYSAQLKSIHNREDKFRLKVECARNLSSDLYGDIIDYQSALKRLA